MAHDWVVYKAQLLKLTGGHELFAVHHGLCEYMLIPSACCTFSDISLANQHHTAHVALSNGILLIALEF
jgi:hypothetical protein